MNSNIQANKPKKEFVEAREKVLKAYEKAREAWKCEKHKDTINALHARVLLRAEIMKTKEGQLTKTILKIICITAIISIGGLAIKVLFFPIHTAERLVDTAYQAQKKVLNADNAIYNYEWFKQQYQDIEATKNKLDNAIIAVDTFAVQAGERSEWTFEDKTEFNRLNSVKLGLQNHLEQMIANYNARASMATRNIFEDNVLPSYIDALTFLRQ